MATSKNSKGENDRQLAEEMQKLQANYREEVLRVTTELAQVKARYEADCKQLLRTGILNADISVGDVEGQSAAPGGSLLPPCTACSIACATDI